MILATLILIISLALLFYFLQITCQKIVRRESDHRHSQPVIEAGRLEFPARQSSLEAGGGQLDRAYLRLALKCDLAAVTYLLKKAAGSRGPSWKERLLLIYSRYLLLSLLVRRALGLWEKPVVQDLAALLKYFAGQVGQRVQVVSFHGLKSSTVS